MEAFMSTEPSPSDAPLFPEHHEKASRFKRFAGAGDIMLVVGLIAVGLVIVAGLFTASGNVHF
jgi:hypothetical protein